MGLFELLEVCLMGYGTEGAAWGVVLRGACLGAAGNAC